MAVKELFIRDSQQEVAEQVDAMQLEIATVLPLRHPGLTRVLGYCLRPPDCFFVMELAEAGSLYDAVLGQKQPAAQWSLCSRLQVLRQVADAMRYLHANRVVHRDLKPQNVLLHLKKPPKSSEGASLAVPSVPDAAAAGAGSTKPSGASGVAAGRQPTQSPRTAHDAHAELGPLACPSPQV